VGRSVDETVGMYMTVFPDGSVGELAVVKPGRFGMAVIITIVDTVLQKWHFKPALDQDGKPIPFRTLFEIRYQIY
jgi:hypothetical protein